MSYYNEKLLEGDLKFLSKWVENKNWNIIKKKLYIICKNKYNNKYYGQNDELDKVKSIIMRLSDIMDADELINLIKNLNIKQTGGYYTYPVQMQGGINFGKLASLAKSKGTAMASKAQAKLVEKGKVLASQAKEYAQQQAQQAQQYVQQQAQQAQQYLQQQATEYTQQAKDYIKNQAQLAEDYAKQYAQQQSQQFHQNLQNKLGNFGQQLQHYGIVPPQPYGIAPAQQGYISTPSITPQGMSSYQQTSQNLVTSTDSIPQHQIESHGMVESVFDFFEDIGEKITGF